MSRKGILGVFASIAVAACVLFACRNPFVGPANLGALANSAAYVSYQVNDGGSYSLAQYNLTSSQTPVSLPENVNVTFALQSAAGVFQATFTWACPGYLVNPQSWVIRSNDGGNVSGITVVTPNIQTYCTLTTQSWDGVASYANAINQFAIGTYATVEIPIFGTTNGDAGSLNPNSTAVLPPGAIVTASYMSLGTAFDAGCTIQVGQPVDGGTQSLFGYYDAGTTLVGSNTVSRETYRVPNEGGPMPIQVNLAAACEAGAGVIGVEWSMPSN